MFVGDFNLYTDRIICCEAMREMVILDLIMCNETGLTNEHIIKDPLGRRDNNMIEFNIWFQHEKPRPKTGACKLNEGNCRNTVAECTKRAGNSLAGEIVMEMQRNISQCS